MKKNKQNIEEEKLTKEIINEDWLLKEMEMEDRLGKPDEGGHRLVVQKCKQKIGRRKTYKGRSSNLTR